MSVKLIIKNLVYVKALYKSLDRYLSIQIINLIRLLFLWGSFIKNKMKYAS